MNIIRKTPSSQLLAWTGRWSMMGDFVVCSECLATQTIYQADKPFEHMSRCSFMKTGLYPWRELKAVLSTVSS